MEQYRDQRIAALKDRIFPLQIEERRYCAILTSPRRNEELTVQAKKNLKGSPRFARELDRRIGLITERRFAFRLTLIRPEWP